MLKRLWREAWRLDEGQVLQAQMALIDRNYVPAYGASVAISVIAALALHAVSEASNAWAWALVQIALGGASVMMRPLLPSLDEPAEVRRYARWLRRVSLLVGLGWGGLAVFIDPARPVTLTIVLGILGGMSSGGTALFTPCWSMAMAFWMGVTLPTIAVLLFSLDVLLTLFGAAGMVYLITLAVFGWHAAQTTRRAICLGLDNDALVQRLRDQSQRAQDAQRVAERALVDAEQANRAKTVFLAAVSHDLRQPLHTMGLLLGVLGQTSLQARQQALLGQAQSAAVATSDMLATLLDFSKVDAGVIRPHWQAMALQPMLQKLAREFSPLAEARGLNFRVRDTAVVVHSDPSLVELMLRNLLVNAIRYTPKGGVLLAARQHGHRVTVEVWDTGVGIPPEDQRRVFQEFQQLGNPERDRNKGLGLGLAIVKGLAQSLGASVALASRPGRGSVFRLTLPRSTAPCAAEEVVRVSDWPELRGVRVLVVDDDASVRAAMRDLLDSWGCSCVTAEGLDDALLAVTRLRPDVLLADHRLRGDVTGVDVALRLAETLGEALPAALITGDTAPERLREAEATGLMVLHKPVCAERIARVLSQLVRQRGAPTSQGLSGRDVCHGVHSEPLS